MLLMYRENRARGKSDENETSEVRAAKMAPGSYYKTFPPPGLHI